MKKKKTFENIFYNGFTQLLAIIVPLVTAPYVARVLTSEYLGVYTYIDSVSQIIFVIGSIGLSSYAVREIAYAGDNIKERSRIFFEIILLRIVLLIISLCSYYFIMRNTEYEYYTKYQIIWFVGCFLDVVWLFNGLEDFKTVAIRSTIVKIANIILIFAFIKTPNDLVKYFLIMGGCQLLGTLICYKNLKNVITFINFTNLNIIRHLKPTIMVALPQIVTLIYYQMDKVMLEKILKNMSLIAFYDQADKIVKLPVTAITAVSSVMLPISSKFYAKNDNNGLAHSIQVSIDTSLMLLLPMTLGLISIAYTFVPWFYGKGYQLVAPIIISLCPIIIARGLSSISNTQYLVPTKKTIYLTISSVFSAIINVIVNLIAIPLFGVYGAVLGTIIAEFSVTLIQYYYMKKYIMLSGITKKCIWYAILSLPFFIMSCILGKILGPHLYTTAIQIICSIIIYLVTLICLKDEKAMYLIQILKGRKD